MRVLVAALASLALNVVFWLRYRGIDTLAIDLRSRDAQKDLILMALGAWLVLESILLMAKLRRHRKATHQRESAESGTLEEELDALYRQRELFQAEIQKAREELAYTNRRLQTVVTERDNLKALIEESEKHVSSSPRDPRDASVSAVPLSRSARL